MKFAIIGTGIAGNVVAHRLRDEHDITVFEANDYVGGHSNTVQVATDEGSIALDTGFMVFNDRTYPNFLRLLDELDVGSQKSVMSFSVQSEKTGLEYNGSSLNALFTQRRNLLRPSFYRMIRDILRFNEDALHSFTNSDCGQSLAEYLAAGNYSKEFIQQYLIPMGAAIWSAEPGVIEQIPADFFVRFFNNHGLLSLKNRPVWKVIDGGSQAYVRKIIAGHRDRIRLSTPVQSVTRDADHVLIKTAGSQVESFDYVFIASHSDEALRMLEDASPIERNVLGAIPFRSNEVILHSDESVMPKRKSAWAAWNYHISRENSGQASVTYHLNRLQGLTTSQQFFVTLNSADRIHTNSVIKRFNYAHPMFTAESINAQARHGEINGLNRTYYCGAYWRNGFHEDGVVSALAALEHFDARNKYAQRYFQRAS